MLCLCAEAHRHIERKNCITNGLCWLCFDYGNPLHISYNSHRKKREVEP